MKEKKAITIVPEPMQEHVERIIGYYNRYKDQLPEPETIEADISALKKFVDPAQLVTINTMSTIIKKSKQAVYNAIDEGKIKQVVIDGARFVFNNQEDFTEV